MSTQREVDASMAGKQTFLFDNGGKLSRPIKAYYYSATANPKDLPIVILMHGAHRNAKANELKTPFNWTEVFVPDAGHSNTRMCRFAFSLFFMDIK